MAKIAAHGKEIGTVYLTTKAKRYMSDGKILVNHGFGWKLGPKLKPGVTVQEAYRHQVERSRQFAEKHPCAAAYKRELHAMCGISKRWKLHAAITTMPDDCDGVWSECCDGYGDNISADVDEVGALCRLYQAAVEEGKRVAG